MAIPIYRSKPLELVCPVCDEVFTADHPPVKCTHCNAVIELYSDQEGAEEHAEKLGVKTVKGPEGVWIVAVDEAGEK